MADNMREKKVWLVTGAGRGMGVDIAQAAVAAQNQIALFFASDGATTIDPDGAGPLFETPIGIPLP